LDRASISGFSFGVALLVPLLALPRIMQRSLAMLVLAAARLGLALADDQAQQQQLRGSPLAAITSGESCDGVEKGLQELVQARCATEKPITCVWAKWPTCSVEDICNFRRGCGYVEDNAFVKFTGYSCSGMLGGGPTDPTAEFHVSCQTALTPKAVGLVVLAAVAAFLCCGCACWCCCCRSRR